jgi:hypothetical protein
LDQSADCAGDNQGKGRENFVPGEFVGFGLELARFVKELVLLCHRLDLLRVELTNARNLLLQIEIVLVSHLCRHYFRLGNIMSIAQGACYWYTAAHSQVLEIKRAARLFCLWLFGSPASA